MLLLVVEYFVEKENCDSYLPHVGYLGLRNKLNMVQIGVMSLNSYRLFSIIAFVRFLECPILTYSTMFLLCSAKVGAQTKRAYLSLLLRMGNLLLTLHLI